MKRKLLCFLLTIILLISTMNVNVFADGINYDGYSGDLPVEDDYDSFYQDALSRKIIGTDDRYTVKNPHVYPYTAICLIEAFDGGKCVQTGTGFLVAPNIVATAAHVLYYNGALVDSVKCHFGSNGPTCSTCYYDVTASRRSFNIYPGYEIDVAAGNHASINDAASINLGQLDLSNICGYLGLKSSYGSMLGKNVRISGYPRPAANDGKTKRSIGQVTSWTTTRMEYNNDTLPGDSGAPIYTKDSTGTYIAVGINTSHPDNVNLRYNIGIPLTVPRITTFLVGESGFIPGGGGFEPEPGGGFEPEPGGGFEPEP